MCGKMAEELLSLKWNNHQAHFVDILTFLREQEIFVDATLACGGKLYAAHKFVLSTCSDYFKQMFTKNPSKHPIVFMKDVTSRDLEALLDFMYNGEVNVPQSSLGSLIKTAEGLQIKGLAVPDDPPAPKRERDREKRENRTQLDHHHHHHSPPAKRPRPRERSPPHSSPSQPSPQVPPTVSRSRSPPPPVTPVGASQINMPPVEATLDEDSRTSIQSGVSGPSEQNTTTNPSLSSKQTSGSTSSQAQQHNPDDSTQHQDALGHGHTGGEEPSPGPSGLHKSQQPQQSKEEPEFEIKQEDVVELGEDDEGDWGVEGDGGGGESSLGADNNPPNFPEVMLPHSDGTMPPSGDPAMLLGPFSSVAAAPLSPASHVPLPVPRQQGSHALFGALAARLGAPPSSSSSSSPPASSPLIGSDLGGGIYRSNMACRGRYRQDRIRSQINLAKTEAASLESLLESGMLGETEAARVQVKVVSKRNEVDQLQKELERLISGQLRQRKFREKMKQKMSAAAAAALQEGQYKGTEWC